MSEDLREITITAKVKRKTYYLFRDFCRAHEVSVYQGIDGAMLAVLERAGVLVDEKEEQTAG